jgi:hypothetical protein
MNGPVGHHLVGGDGRIESLDGNAERFEPIEAFLERFEGAVLNHADHADDRRRDLPEDSDGHHRSTSILSVYQGLGTGDASK